MTTAAFIMIGAGLSILVFIRRKPSDKFRAWHDGMYEQQIDDICVHEYAYYGEGVWQCPHCGKTVNTEL